MLRRLYDWTLRMAERPWALGILAVVSFAESSFFPITPLVMLVPMVLARPDRWFVIAGVCTLASVAGGVFGWWLGREFEEAVARPLLEFYGKTGFIDEAERMFNENGFIAVLMAAFTPFPYKVITIASGFFNLPVTTLITASLIGRAGQFFIAAIVIRLIGPPAKDLIDRYFGIIATVAGILLIGGFVAAKMLV